MCNEGTRRSARAQRFGRKLAFTGERRCQPGRKARILLISIGLSFWAGLVLPAFAQSPQRQTDPDPIVEWCTEHTNPATCSDVSSCIAECVRRSGPHDPAAVAAQLKQEHEARQRQEQSQVEATEKLRLAQERGYRPIAFNDFQLDGKELARTQIKLMLRGFYSKSGDIDILQPTGMAVAVARNYGIGAGVPLLTEDASREVRALFLQCSENVLAQLGCPMTITGHADMCEMTDLGGSKNVPCVSVEDGWQ